MRRKRKKQAFDPQGCLGYLGIIAVMLIVGTALNNPEESKAVLAIATAGAILYFWKRPSAKRYGIGKQAGLHEILALSPASFEVFTRDLLAEHGFSSLRLNGGAGDLGVDILGRDPSGRYTAVQCKLYAPSRRIGSKDIQTFIGMQRIHHGADRGIFVTTADFTPAARELAANHGIWLIDGMTLISLHHSRSRGLARQRTWFG